MSEHAAKDATESYVTHGRLLPDDVDVVVVGSGAGGMAAALTAALRGLSVVVIEKSNYFGGTSAISGGVIWVPNNVYLQEAGGEDSLDAARTYLENIVGERIPAKRREAYLREGPKMVSEFRERTRWVRWSYLRGYPDYYPEVDGGYLPGRGIHPKIVDARALGAERSFLRPPARALEAKGVTVTGSEFHSLNMLGRTWSGKLTAFRIGARFLRTRLTGAKLRAAGQALVVRLRLALRDVDVPVFVSTRFVDLVVTGQDTASAQVTGVLVERNGAVATIRARRGVILAAGGFSRSQAMREKYLPRPTSADWTSAPDGLTGDVIGAGERIGAALDLMDGLWGQPSTLVPTPTGGTAATILITERFLPGTLIVNAVGDRYQNECAPYSEFVKGMYAHNSAEASAIPSWLIFDQRVKDRYLILGVLPRRPFARAWYESGFIQRAQTVEDLASRIGVCEETLAATIRRYNGFMRAGHDDDYGRGDSAYDRYYGDPTLKHRSLQTIERPPYFALRVYPGDIGTKGGFVIDEYSRVMRENDTPIQGLYATGNCAASVMGEEYPGPGATIGPAMVCGYIAANHVALGAGLM